MNLTVQYVSTHLMLFVVILVHQFLAYAEILIRMRALQLAGSGGR